MTRPLITLLTDFGTRDPSAAICRGVIFRIAPGAEVLDLTHDVRKFAIRDGALMLWSALPYLPVGYHVAVVDPGVGTARRPIAVQMARGDILVGPDNGLLMGPAERLGGVARAVELVAAEYRLPVISTSFHGRDIFAPAAAHLANGVPLEELGPALEPAGLAPSPLPAPRPINGGIATEIVYVDTFGNVKLSALAADLVGALGGRGPGTRLEIRSSGRDPIELPWATTFGEVRAGEPLVYEDSYGRVCVAVNQGSAAERLALANGLEVEIRSV
jgi:S-adenosylmethionine hydrolase